MIPRTITRREACTLVGGSFALAALGFSGCGLIKSERQQFLAGETDSRQGYDSDTEVKSYPVHLTLFADSNVQWFKAMYLYEGSEAFADSDRLWDFTGFYQAQFDREQVTFDIVYVDPIELLELAQTGFPEGDGILALENTIIEGNKAGTVDGGANEFMVRDMNYNFPEKIVITRAVGSTAALPAAATLSGEDAPDSSINQLQQLPSFDGFIAVADPFATTEGWVANRVLARQKLYSDESGFNGTYADSVVEKIKLYPNQDAAMAAVATGECQLGFALRSSINGGRYPQVETCYTPPAGNVSYKAAALTNSAEPGVARDFFTFITMCS